MRLSESENNEIALGREVRSARRMLRDDVFWTAVSCFVLLLGLVGRFGITWALWAGVGAIASLASYAYLPRWKEDKRHEWDLRRDALLEKWSLLVQGLSKSSRKRYDTLHDRVSRLGDLTPRRRKGSLLRPGEYLLWLYLKLLMARDLLAEGAATSNEDIIVDERNRILTELEGPGLSETARQSKEETVLILDQRLEAASRRAGRVQEIESDLTRIEQKLALMFDRAAHDSILGDSGRRINFSDEVQTGTSLGSLNGSKVEEMDALVNAQVCA